MARDTGKAVGTPVKLKSTPDEVKESHFDNKQVSTPERILHICKLSSHISWFCPQLGKNQKSAVCGQFTYSHCKCTSTSTSGPSQTAADSLNCRGSVNTSRNAAVQSTMVVPEDLSESQLEELLAVCRLQS